jgi:hypothetical protein
MFIASYALIPGAAMAASVRQIIHPNILGKIMPKEKIEQTIVVVVNNETADKPCVLHNK